MKSFIRYPELLFDLTGVGLRIQSVHLVINWTQLIGWNGRVAAETGLQDGVVDEDVLLLRKEETKVEKSEWELKQRVKVWRDVTARLTYLCLHHVDPPRPQLSDTVVDVDHTFSLRHVQHDVDHDETPSTPCPRTDTQMIHTRVRQLELITGQVTTVIIIPAVNHRGAGRGRSFGLDTADEAQQAGGVERHAVVRPAGEMKLTDLSDLGHAPLSHMTQVRNISFKNRNDADAQTQPWIKT